MNVLAAFTFDMKFTYVLVGWEGTVSDSRMIKNALTRRYPLKIAQGKYYLVDAGFMIKSGLITPYRGERYHLRSTQLGTPLKPPVNCSIFDMLHYEMRSSELPVSSRSVFLLSEAQPNHITLLIH
ncbi:uncharacterized protein LOC144554765 [Carex rostrata]